MPCQAASRSTSSFYYDPVFTPRSCASTRETRRLKTENLIISVLLPRPSRGFVAVLKQDAEFFSTHPVR